LKLTSREAILDTQHAILKDHADVIQADVTSVLKKAEAGGKKHRIAQLWVTNELIVRDVDKEVVELLSKHPDVESLVAEQFIPLEQMVEEGTSVLNNNTILNQWGVINVRANEVWASGNRGSGIAVGVIDTGVRPTHQTLAPTYRGNNPGENHNYNWLAPNNNAGVPTDTSGHGTHVTGTIAGTLGIGVAYDARWVSCRGCGILLCSNFDLSQCGNFMACPTNTAGQAPQCNRAPRVVNNSWGGGSNNPWYNTIIQSWRNAQIVPIFAAGNSGPNCGTVNSPGDQPGAISVASITSTNIISDFSSVGPAVTGVQKPNIAAPGSSVVSASHLTDTGLSTLSGTSMAAPHAAGVAALILSTRPGLSVVQVENALAQGTVAHASQGRTCSGVSEAQRPNFHTGAGRIDAVIAVQS